MSWRRVGKSLQAVVAHGLLFSFTLLLVLKLDRPLFSPWWIVFVPLWLFHAVVARGRFSLPAPSVPNDRRWAPFHSLAATPLLVAFELLLCLNLQSSYTVNLKIVFLPLLALELAILIDNIRMCRALMPGEEENMTDEAIWQTLPEWNFIQGKYLSWPWLPVIYEHFWVAISMVFLIAATAFTVLKLCGAVVALGWWDLFINYGVAECFAFLNCTRWYNPAIHRRPRNRDISSSSTNVRYLEPNSSLQANSDEDHEESSICSLQDIGGHVMKIPLIAFQIMLFMRLEGTPPSARLIPIPVLFSPLILLQGAGLFFAFYRFVERCVLLLHSGACTGRYFRISSKIRDCFAFMHHGSRLLGWWSIDQGSHEEQAQLYHAGSSGYDTFAPDIVKKMPKAELADEIWRLQAALSEQTEITKFSQEEYERLQNEKILCRVCFEDQINVVLLPCRHHILCSSCCEKCKRCPVCRVFIEERLPIHDV